jgi:hypothetical protein
VTFAGLPFWAFTLLTAGCAGVLYVLHLLRVRPREVRVITTLFWSHAMERTRARTLLERFRYPWTYLLLLATCLVLALALAKPEPIAESADRVHEVIIVDAGASMAAPERAQGGSRWDAARAAALAEAARLSLTDRLAVIVADPLPRVVHRFEDPRPLLAHVLAQATPAELPAARADAVRLAQELVRGRTHPLVTLITDRPAEAGAPSETRVVRVGEPVNNAAILGALFEPQPQDPLHGRLHVRVGYWGDRAQDTTLAVARAGGAPLLNDTQRLEPGSTYDFVVPELPADGDELVVRVTPEDAVPADSRTRFRLPLRSLIRVALRGVVPAALRILTAADPAVHLVDEGQESDVEIAVRADDPAEGTTRIVISDRGQPIAVGAPVYPIGTGPLVAGLDFEGAGCGTGSALGRKLTGLQPLLTADEQVLAAASTAGPGRRLCLASALVADDAEICRRPAFAVFMGRSLRWLAGWDADPVVLPPERILDDPLWAERVGLPGALSIMPGSTSMSDLTAAAKPAGGPEMTRAIWSMPAWFELLLYAGLVGLLVDAALHCRGRIS